MLLDKIRKSLRITHNALDDEIQDLITAALLDLQQSGVKKTDESDPLIIRAVTIYCKANFGFDNPDFDKLNQSFLSLKMHMSLAGDYNVIS